MNPEMTYDIGQVTYEQGPSNQSKVPKDTQGPQDQTMEPTVDRYVMHDNLEYDNKVVGSSSGTKTPSLMSTPSKSVRGERIRNLGKRRSQKVTKQPILTLDKLTDEIKATPFMIKPPEDTPDSFSVSSLTLSKSRLNRMEQERERETAVLKQQMLQGDDDLKSLLQNLQNQNRNREQFNYEQSQNRADKFEDDITKYINKLEKSIEKQITSLYEVTKKVYSQLNHNKDITKALFRFITEDSKKDFSSLAQVTTKQSKVLTHFETELKEFDQQLDLILSKVEELYELIDPEKYNDLIKALSQTTIYFKTQLTNMYQYIQQLQNQTQSFTFTIRNLTNENEHLQAEVSQYRQEINQVRQTQLTLSQQVANIEKMVNISYFSSNLLIDNDRMVKEGLKESGTKQAQLLDMLKLFEKFTMETTDKQTKVEAARRFQDSVRSMNIHEKTKLNFPPVQKIPEFMGYDIKEESRSDLQNVVHDENHRKYRQNVEEFFKKYPKDNIYMTVQNAPQGPSNPKDDDDLQTFLRGLEANVIPQPSKSPPKVLKRTSREDSIKSNAGAFAYDKLLGHYTPNAADPTGLKYVPTTTPNRFYHKFNFKEKFDRKSHPKIFLLQFETLAQQCGLTEEEKALQFMFAMQGEYLEWYKARYLYSTPQPTWHQLKMAFLKTFTKETTLVKEELQRMMQRQGETPSQFLQRLREVAQASDLSDNEIKQQFCYGLINEKAKAHIYNVKLFDKNMFDEHTTTTLCQELERQAKLFHYDLSTSKPRKDSSQSRKPNTIETQSSKPVKNTSYRRPYRPYRTYQSNSPQKKPENNTNQVSQSQNKKQDFTRNDKSKTRRINFVETNPKAVVQSQSESTTDNDEDVYEYDPADQIVMDDQSSSSTESTIPQDANVLWAGNATTSSFPAPEEINNAEIKAGEGEQVHSIFRSQQKNTQNLNEKLVDIIAKGKVLPRTNYATVRQNTYIHLPDQQLLQQCPRQFISGVHYLFECLQSEDNLLQTDDTIRTFKTTIQNLQNRYEELNLSLKNSSHKAQKQDSEQVQSISINPIEREETFAIIGVQPVNFLYFIKLQFQNKDVEALIDTGSTITVISSHFCKRNKIAIPDCHTHREVILADGSTTKMLQWNDAKIQLDKYNTILGDILISNSKSYDMLFGLNAYLAIGANMNQGYLRYCVQLDGKDKFGKLPLIEKTRTQQVVNTI